MQQGEKLEAKKTAASLTSFLNFLGRNLNPTHYVLPRLIYTPATVGDIRCNA